MPQVQLATLLSVRPVRTPAAMLVGDDALLLSPPMAATCRP